MFEIKDVTKTIRPGEKEAEFELQQTVTVKVEDDVDLSNTAEQLVDAQDAVCGKKAPGIGKAQCELQQEQLLLGQQSPAGS